VTRRPFTRIHFSETRWTYTEPDAIYLEVAGYFVSIIEYNIAPLYTAIEEHRLLRIRAHPEFANSPTTPRTRSQRRFGFQTFRQSDQNQGKEGS